MRILIVGAGNTGKLLAARFCEERHDVVVIEREPERLDNLDSQLDLLAVPGDGCDPRTLEAAGLARSDMVVAVTDQDETNILCCAFAEMAGVTHRIARVSRIDLNGYPHYDLRRMGVQLAVNPKEECALELFNILRMPGAIETVDLMDGRLLAAGMSVHMDSPLLQGSLAAFSDKDWLERMRFIAVVRGDKVLAPRGDTSFLVGDEIYMVARPDDLNRFLYWAWPESAPFDKIVIAGGGDVGRHLARLLEAADMHTVIVEQDPEEAQACAEAVNRTLVIKGDALDGETYSEAGLNDNTAMVAVTGDDENNIIACLVAAKMGARFTAAQIAKPDYVPVINSLSLLDRAVSPHLSMINAIMHFARGRNVRSAASFRGLRGELLEIVMGGQAKWIGKAVRELKLPPGVTLAAVMRGDSAMIATGELTIRPEDRVVIYATEDAVGKLKSICR